MANCEASHLPFRCALRRAATLQRMHASGSENLQSTWSRKLKVVRDWYASTLALQSRLCQLTPLAYSGPTCRSSIPRRLEFQCAVYVCTIRSAFRSKVPTNQTCELDVRCSARWVTCMLTMHAVADKSRAAFDIDAEDTACCSMGSPCAGRSSYT